MGDPSYAFHLIHSLTGHDIRNGYKIVGWPAQNAGIGLVLHTGMDMTLIIVNSGLNSANKISFTGAGVNCVHY